MAMIDIYRVGVIKHQNRKFMAIIIDIAKDANNAIVAINNTKSMVSSFETTKGALDFIGSSKVQVDYILSDVLGLTDDYIFVSHQLSKSAKAKVYNIYHDAFPKIQKSMYSKPSLPMAGQTFKQDRLTADYFFFFEKLTVETFAVMFAINQVANSQARQVIQELKL